MGSSTDRRVRRTRRLLHESLIGLMLERGYARITVQDILDRADVGRSTFYSHYRDKDDLLAVSCAEYLRGAISDASSSNDRPWGPVPILLSLAEQHPAIYQALAGPRSSGVLLRASRHMVYEALIEYLRHSAPNDTDVETLANFLSWGLVGLLGAIAEGEMSAREAYTIFESTVRT
ncbi:MAG: TetR family transcriptional regulator [Rhodococcus sp.]|nr:TetR family transcriptional regulator [Rhodococcus sp. (in: high G+C Gram-positive bacteria)]